MSLIQSPGGASGRSTGGQFDAGPFKSHFWDVRLVNLKESAEELDFRCIFPTAVGYFAACYVRFSFIAAGCDPVAVPLWTMSCHGWHLIPKISTHELSTTQ